MLSSQDHKCDEHLHFQYDTILLSKNDTVFLNEILLLSPLHKVFPQDEGRMYLPNSGNF
jgi:hypothetical protein